MASTLKVSQLLASAKSIWNRKIVAEDKQVPRKSYDYIYKNSSADLIKFKLHLFLRFINGYIYKDGKT